MEELKDSRKGGRPPIPNKLDKTIRVRITSDDYHRCKKIAEEANMNVTEYFRKMMTEGKVINLFSAAAKEDTIQLTGMANNLNQLAKEAHTYGTTSVEKKANELLDAIRSMLNRYDV
jgi:hypothetical protein